MASKKKSSKKSALSRKSSRQPASTRAKRGEPKTMEELLAQQDDRARTLSRGQRVKGTVIEKTKKNVVFDIGGKSEGVVAEKAFQEAKNFIKNLKVGDEVETSVLIPETPDGFIILSLRNAASEESWKKLEAAKAKATPISVFGKSVNPSGVTVEVGSLLGFIPSSQIGRAASKNYAGLVGRHFETIPIEVDRATNKIVLSEKAVSEALEIKLADSALKKIKEGEIYTGVVTTVVDFGCFVRIDVDLKSKPREAESRPAGEKAPVEGLVHISELSWEKVDDPRNLVSGGDKVKVKVIGKNLAGERPGAGKLALSIKQAQEDPWLKIEKRYKKDTKVKGKVVRVSDFGSFVQLEPGVEGLIHMTKIPPGERLEEGQEVNVYVEDLDKKGRKLSLGLVLTKKPVGYK